MLHVMVKSQEILVVVGYAILFVNAKVRSQTVAYTETVNGYFGLQDQ
jgi:hypothetical protein